MRKAVTVSALATAAATVSHPGGLVHTGRSSLEASSSLYGLRSDIFIDSIPRGGASKEDVPATYEHDNKSPKQKQSHAASPEATTGATTPPNSKKKKKKGSNRRPTESNDDTNEPSSAHRRESNNNTSSSKETSESTDKGSGQTSKSHTMSPHQEKIVNEILKEDDYYKILGTTREATPTEIQKAYRKRAVLTHPDKMPNSDRRAFDKVAEAYDVLNDDTKRKQYNQFGKTGGGAPSAEDMFRSFFSSQHHPFFRGAAQAPTAPRRNRNVRYQLEVTLEELYKGVTRSVLVSQPSPYGHFQQQHQPKRKRVEVHIPAGSFSGQSVVLSGEMDWDQDQTPADIVFILVQRQHPIFTRKGYDLAMELTITLEEAIGGVRRSFTHLDGRTLVVESAHNTHSDVPLVIQTGAVQVLKGEGMPKRSGKGHGDLYIQYKVEMPSPSATRLNLTPTECEELKQLLSKLQRKHTFSHQHQHHDNAKEEKQDAVHILHTASATDFGRNGPEPEDEEHDAATNVDGEHEEESGAFRTFPFGAGASGRQFFYSSGSSSSADAHPFFRDDWKDDGNGNVQCQQM